MSWMVFSYVLLLGMKFMKRMDFPGIKPAEVENNGCVLHLLGGCKVTQDDQVMETKFDKKFMIGENVDTDKMTVNLADGILTL